MSVGKAGDLMNWRERLVCNSKCEKCGKEPDDLMSGAGVYILNFKRTIARRITNDLFGKNKVIDYEYYCLECCKNDNMFEDFRENYERFNILTDL